MTYKPVSLNNFAIATIGKNYCKIHFWFITKSEAVNIIKNVDLSEKKYGQL